MPKKGKGKAAEPPPEAIDVERMKLQAELAHRDAEDDRQRAAAAQLRVEEMSTARAEQSTEVDELYQYLDAQMLSSARDRQANEAALREAQEEATRKQNELQTQMREAQEEADRTISELRAEVEEKDRELEELSAFRGVRPKMESEIAALREQIRMSKDAQQQQAHQLQVDLWRQREALNGQMLQRIKQAKDNFLGITSEMLDSTVHRTMLENQQMIDELALQVRRDVFGKSMGRGRERASHRRSQRWTRVVHSFVPFSSPAPPALAPRTPTEQCPSCAPFARC